MRLKEFLLEESIFKPVDLDAMTPKEFCERIRLENYTIHPDGTIYVDGDVNLIRKNLTKIPVKFGKVSGSFDCSFNLLTSLEGCPKEVGMGFYCHYNQLTALEGGPRKVGWGFYCHYNQLTTLEGGPRKVGWGFYCHNNQLTTLKGCPVEVGKTFYCSNNRLTSLKGCPKKARKFYCTNNVKQFTKEEVRKHCELTGSTEDIEV